MTFAPQDLPALLSTARRLRLAAAAGRAETLLRGKNLALLSEASDAGTERVRSAAMRLGASVTHLRPSESRLDEPELQTTAQLLGRLYDAIDCEAMPWAVVEQIDRNAGVPVYFGLGDDTHPARELETLLASENGELPPTGLDDFVVQAVLVNSLA